MPGSDSQDVRIALRCGYGNTGPSAKTSRNLPLRTIVEVDRSVVGSYFHPDQSVAEVSLLTHGSLPKPTELVETKCPRQGDTCIPQGLTAATPFAPEWAPSCQKELRRGVLRKQTPLTAWAVSITFLSLNAR